MGVGLEVVAALVSALLGGLLPLLQGTIKTYLKKHPERRAALEARLGKGAIEFLGGPEPETSKTLFRDLARSSSEMDRTVAAITKFTAERQATVEKLEEQLSLLSLQEEELKRRIEGLKNVPLPAAEYFAQMLEKGERKSALRDYGLFLAGVIVSAIVGVILKLAGLA